MTSSTPLHQTQPFPCHAATPLASQNPGIKTRSGVLYGPTVLLVELRLVAKCELQLLVAGCKIPHQYLTTFSTLQIGALGNVSHSILLRFFFWNFFLVYFRDFFNLLKFLPVFLFNLFYSLNLFRLMLVPCSVSHYIHTYTFNKVSICWRYSQFNEGVKTFLENPMECSDDEYLKQSQINNSDEIRLG